MKKLTVKQHATVQKALYVVGVALILPYSLYGLSACLWLATACIITGVLWRFLFIKCPHCGDKLTGSRVIPNCCPNCGKSLDENPVEE